MRDLDRYGCAVSYWKSSMDHVRDEAKAKRSKHDIWSGSFDMLWN
ncbi:hypothetical protein [Cereibacter sphaeroides]|nr:hypothetical protein [Cereibacter sphaeroides]